MSSNERITIVLLVLLVTYVVPVRLILWRFLQPLARKVLIGQTLAMIFWATMNGLTRWQPTFWGWFFASNNELVYIAMLSSVQLVLAGLAALLIGTQHAKPVAHRLPWLALAAVFVFMGLDEYYAIHESSDIWNTLYTLNGVMIIALAAVIYALERDITAPLFLVVGVGLMGFGGVILDEYSNEVALSLGGFELVCHYRVHGIFCTDLSVVEELFETAGSGLILIGFISSAEKHHAPPRWKLTRWALTGFAAFWVLWMCSHTWLVPTVEAKTRADPVTVEYMDGALELESYNLSRDVAAPGDTVDVTLYFRAREMLKENYYLSVHLLSHPDVQSVAQMDVQLGDYEYPTTAWLPYLSVKSVVQLTLPDDLLTPASYWIMVRVWESADRVNRTDEPETAGADATEGEPVAITKTDRQQLAQDTVVLGALPVLGRPPDSAPPTASDYRFDHGIRLYGFDLPGSGTPGQPITIRFWWKTSQKVGQTRTQFLHFYPADGSEDFFVFDHEPFDSRLPFADWPGGLDAVDAHTITLPADMPPGEYRVHTGIYDPHTGNRVPVKDGSGETVQDYSIFLGTFVVSE
jgi:hypothetical protein